MEYKPTIGLEIHIELATKSKMFCGCKNDPDEVRPNVYICPVCVAHPGTLPAINKEAVKKVIKTALALNCQIGERSYFERKNYFYPDLPKGYQISQYQLPLSRNGYLLIGEKKIRIRRVHLEEDTAKLLHPEGKDYSLVDFNRAGIPLMELVTEPDINSAEEIKRFVKELQLILRYLNVSEANMEKGQMRVEINISLAPVHASTLGVKVEVKNLNSTAAAFNAVNFEIERQKALLEKGEKILQETRGWDDKKEITFSQREKEEARDYRYFPEPDLPPLNLKDEFFQKIQSEIPELPFQRRERFKKEYNLSDKEIEFYISQKDLGEYFEKVVSELRGWVKAKKPEIDIESEEFGKFIKLASNYITTNLQSFLRDKEFQEKEFPITPENFAEFLSLIYVGETSSKIAKVVLEEMFRNGGDPSQIIEEKGLGLISDRAKIEKVVKEVIKKNQKAVEDYKNGKETALQFLIGQVMAQTRGRANPEMANKILRKILE